jgi:hypothetical protein
LKYQINLLAYHSEVQSFNINKVWKQESRWRVGGERKVWGRGAWGKVVVRHWVGESGGFGYHGVANG